MFSKTVIDIPWGKKKHLPFEINVNFFLLLRTMKYVGKLRKNIEIRPVLPNLIEVIIIIHIKL